MTASAAMFWLGTSGPRFTQSGECLLWVVCGHSRTAAYGHERTFADDVSTTRCRSFEWPLSPISGSSDHANLNLATGRVRPSPAINAMQERGGFLEAVGERQVEKRAKGLKRRRFPVHP